jgi:hypothetical protein
MMRVAAPVPPFSHRAGVFRFRRLRRPARSGADHLSGHPLRPAQ